MFFSVIANDVCVWHGLKPVWHVRAERSTLPPSLLLSRADSDPQNSGRSCSWSQRRLRWGVVTAWLQLRSMACAPGSCSDAMPAERVCDWSQPGSRWAGAFAAIPSAVRCPVLYVRIQHLRCAAGAYLLCSAVRSQKWTWSVYFKMFSVKKKRWVVEPACLCTVMC